MQSALQSCGLDRWNNPSLKPALRMMLHIPDVVGLASQACATNSVV